MSKLEELIEKLCPNGVEYKTIGDIATYRRGSFPQPYTNTSFYGGEDAMPFVQVADIEDDGFKLKDKTKQTISKIAQPKSIFVPKGTVICSIQGTIGRVAITQYDSYVDRTIAIFESLNDEINKKFFAYCIEVKFGIEKQFARGSTLKTITKEEFTKFCIPVPPLEVQYEIVHILDDFTLLSAELSAELKARQKQYDYYSEKLLNNVETKEITFGEACDVITDYVAAGSFGDIAKNVQYINIPDYAQLIRTVDIKNNFQKADYIYVSEKAFNYLWRVNLDKECIILPNIGVNCGEVYYLDPEMLIYEKNVLGPNAILVRSNTNNIKYLSYVFKTNDFQKQLRRIISPAGQTKFNKTELKKLILHLPSKEIQDNVVEKLDKLDEICNNIYKGLPAEIEARQKQYEYYRDKLLTFKELKENE